MRKKRIVRVYSLRDTKGHRAVVDCLAKAPRSTFHITSRHEYTTLESCPLNWWNARQYARRLNKTSSYRAEIIRRE